ncbi:YHS domain-containing (seleno)protein [Saccharophagus degradans]|uniref:YHS n=1 Tax=Saccharophagus degradans (strain 2-40 / ATCC 43961 / DSM 17024) TaxID=203122 RepID=Q21H03_SACD2|nr:YHS domain-containing (seleno)protein [Saccharophagus degradans]ABD82026.1 YHS [Saccharophagus degradans 2-40]
MSIKKIVFGLIASVFFSAAANAGSADHSAPAVQGYDVVSYHIEKRPAKGNGHYVATHNGATYLFSSEENLSEFKKSPEKYAPAYNGYCAFGVSVGKKFIGDPEVWRIVEGKLYLNLDANIQSEWLKDVPGKIKEADKNWKRIASKSPESL